MSKTVTRKTQLEQIHIAKKALKMDDDIYQLFMAKNCAGITSAANRDMHGRFKLIQAFKEAGWTPKYKFKPRGGAQKIFYKEAQSRYMIALWNKLFKAGLVKNESVTGEKLTANQALERWIANQTNEKGQQIPIEGNPDLLNAVDRNRCIEALKSWLKRIK